PRDSVPLPSPLATPPALALVHSASSSTPPAASRTQSARACSRPAELSRRSSSGSRGSASAWRTRISRNSGPIGSGKLAPRLADVLRGRPDDPVVRVLLEQVGRPPRDPAGGEQRREQVGGDAEVAVDRGRPEVDVRVQALLLKDSLLRGQRDLVPVRLAGFVRELLRDPLQDPRAPV